MNWNLLRKTWVKLLAVFLLCAASFSAGWWLNGRLQDPDEGLLDSAYRVIAHDALFNEHSGGELADSAIRGMLSTIDDPFAELIEPDAARNFMNTFSGKTGVVGLYAENQGGQVVITIVFPNGPADRAGVRVGDVILAIDGVPLNAAADSSETGLLLRGDPDTTVSVKIQRGEEINEYELQRQVQEYVSSRMLPEGIGYIALNAFNRTASQQMKDALAALLAQDPSGLVWDLRNNEGGDMQAAQQILSDFIEDGLLFSAQLTHGRTVAFSAQGKAIAGEIPLVVLIDHTTYSAAETCAAAINETGRGKTVGSATYGKGIIQATVPLPEDAMLQFTVAKWLSPHGEWFHQRGVPPLIEASDDPATEADEVLQKGIKVLLAGQS